MLTTKIMQAIEYFENNVDDEVYKINTINDNRIEIDNKEFIIVDSEEREDIFSEYQINLISDLGLNAFTPEGKQYIIDNCIDTEEIEVYRNECNQNYIDSIRDEAPNNDEDAGSRLEEETKENGLSAEDEYLELLNSNEDVLSWYKNNFGEDALNEYITCNELINIEKVCEYISSVDGYALSLASFDGEEIETEDYYMYRVN